MASLFGRGVFASRGMRNSGSGWSPSRSSPPASSLPYPGNSPRYRDARRARRCKRRMSSERLSRPLQRSSAKTASPGARRHRQRRHGELERFAFADRPQLVEHVGQAAPSTRPAAPRRPFRRSGTRPPSPRANRRQPPVHPQHPRRPLAPARQQRRLRFRLPPPPAPRPAEAQAARARTQIINPPSEPTARSVRAAPRIHEKRLR